MNQKYSPGQKVSLSILRETDLGYVAKINGTDEGLIYHNEVFERLRAGREIDGYIGKIRENGQIDLLLQPFGNLGSEQLALKIIEQLELNKGFLEVNDHSPAEKIYDLFGVSKKKFKMALGLLYKKRAIKITEKGIELI